MYVCVHWHPCSRIQWNETVFFPIYLFEKKPRKRMKKNSGLKKLWGLTMWLLVFRFFFLSSRKISFFFAAHSMCIRWLLPPITSAIYKWMLQCNRIFICVESIWRLQDLIDDLLNSVCFKWNENWYRKSGGNEKFLAIISFFTFLFCRQIRCLSNWPI